MSLPLNRCGKNGDHATTARYYLSQCWYNGDAIWGPCEFGNDETCTNTYGFVCHHNNYVLTGNNFLGLTTSVNGEICDSSLSNQRLTTTMHYMEIKVHQGANTQAVAKDCPNGALFSYE